MLKQMIQDCKDLGHNIVTGERGAKMTPGPWKVVSEQTISDVHGPVAYVYTFPGKGMGETNANARAIAALPELIEAAHAMLLAFDAKCFYEGYTEHQLETISGNLRRILVHIEKSQ